MNTEQKLRDRQWFKLAMIVLGVFLVIMLVELKLHNPFEKIKLINQSSNEEILDMTSVVTSSDPFLGNEQAKIQIVEFGDFACPYCRQAAPIMRSLMAEYQDKVFFQFRDYPVVTTESMWLAMAADCADEQNKFWAFSDKLFQNQGEVSEETIYNLAKSVGLATDRFKNCLTTQKYKSEVVEDFNDGEALKIEGTPTFFINGRKVKGVPDAEIWRSLLDELISLYEEN
ncbi:MAG TPA: DsbA family protein [Candidatus Bipolaricaulota bacterium]|nr:DsbA family protein [Candidatus Bipolaricaulota bacterium]